MPDDGAVPASIWPLLYPFKKRLFCEIFVCRCLANANQTKNNRHGKRQGHKQSGDSAGSQQTHHEATFEKESKTAEEVKDPETQHISETADTLSTHASGIQAGIGSGRHGRRRGKVLETILRLKTSRTSAAVATSPASFAKVIFAGVVRAVCTNRRGWLSAYAAAESFGNVHFLRIFRS